MKGKIVLMAVLAVLMLGSCATKQSAINQLERYSYELRDNAQYYSVRDWQNAVDDFKTIRKRISKFERDYTPQEKGIIRRKRNSISANWKASVRSIWLREPSSV